MRIGIEAHTLEGDRTGVGQVLFNVLKEWDKSSPKDLKFILYFKKEIPELNLSSKFEKKLLNSKSNAWFRHVSVCRQANKDKLDILFCPDYVSPIFYSKKTALILHDIIYQAHPEWYNWPSFWDRILLKKFSKISAKRAEVIFVPSEFTRQEVIKYYQIKPSKVIVTLWSTKSDFKPIKDQSKLEQIKKKYGIKNKFILYIGSIFTRRHIPEVIQAFKNVSKQIPDYQFLIAGRNYANISEKEFKHEKIIYKGYLPNRDVVDLLKAADLSIYLSDYEGFGLPVLESLACGTPVMTSRKTSIPEVANKSAIYIQDNSNIQEIEQGIIKGLTDQELRQNLIESGLTQAKRFSWPRAAQAILDALLKIS